MAKKKFKESYHQNNLGDDKLQQIYDISKHLIKKTQLLSLYNILKLPQSPITPS